MTTTAHPNAANSVGLAEFLATAGTLTLAQRKLLVDQALVLLEQNYAHLPLKVAMHAVNPVQRLRVLRARLERRRRPAFIGVDAFFAVDRVRRIRAVCDSTIRCPLR